ncbi:reverse transcriptase domain-containing protein [Tanacetum coccineum]
MTEIFHDMVEDFMEVFMDDFSVFGNSFDCCLDNLDRMLARWIEVDRAKIDVIAKLPYPTNVKGVRSFMGHAGFYRRFIKDFSMISKPMTQLLMKDVKFDFFDDCEKAFNILKEKLTTAPIIISPDWNVPFELMCDASDFAVGAVLGQQIDGKFKPIYYASKTLNNAQEHYTTTKKELLAVLFSFDKTFTAIIVTAGHAGGLTTARAPEKLVAKMAPKRATRSTPVTTTPAPTATTTTTVTNAQLQAMIDQGVSAALAARDANRNGVDSHTSGTSVRGYERIARECTYQDFMKYKPLYFKGTEEVVELTQWFERMETVFHISNCSVENQIKFSTCTLLAGALTWWNSHVMTVTVTPPNWDTAE